MWLLDANVPKKLVAVLAEFGIEAETAESRGWKSLTNGQLVEAAAEAGFACVLTRDTLSGESAARVLRRLPRFCVILITIPQLRGAQFLDEFRQVWAASPIRPEPGTVVHWPP